eukprot:19963-Heterococcus_DN1.PRE.4
MSKCVKSTDASHLCRLPTLHATVPVCSTEQLSEQNWHNCDSTVLPYTISVSRNRAASTSSCASEYKSELSMSSSCTSTSQFTSSVQKLSLEETRDSPVVPKGRQLQRRHISSSSLCILLTDSLHLAEAQWVDQCMKWLYTREATLTASHLCLYHAAQLRKVRLTCAPVTDEVQTVECDSNRNTVLLGATKAQGEVLEGSSCYYLMPAAAAAATSKAAVKSCITATHCAEYC